jgi:Lysozyme inhibitor LprI
MLIPASLVCSLVFSVLTSQPQAAHQQAQTFDAKRQQLRAQAKAAFDAEAAREKGGDCREAQNTQEFNTCFGDAVTIADQHLEAYEEALEAILALHDPDQPSTPSVGIAGPVQTPQQDATEFDHLEQLWHTYLDAASTAAFHQFDGGTGGPSFGLETHLRLVRNHLRELNTLYGIELRL